MRPLDTLAQATLDTAQTLPEKDLPALADALLRLLAQKGLSSKSNLFLRLLRRTLARENRLLPLTLTTPSGDAGKHGASLASFVHLALGKPVELHETMNPTLLGGARLAYRDERFDASLRGALHSLSTHLSSPLPYDPQ